MARVTNNAAGVGFQSRHLALSDAMERALKMPDLTEAFTRMTTLPDFTEAFTRATTLPDFTEAFTRATTLPDFTEAFTRATTLPDFTETLGVALAAIAAGLDVQDDWTTFDIGRLTDADARRYVQAVVAVLVYVIAFLCTVEEYDIASAIGTLTGVNALVAAQFAWWVTGQLLRRLSGS
jgi:hypothetical protein